MLLPYLVVVCPSPSRQVVGIITRHNLTHKRLHEIRQKKTEAMEQRKRKKSTPKAATSPIDDVFIDDDFTSTSSVWVMYASWPAIITVQALHCTCCAHKVYVYSVQTGEQKVGLCVHVCVCGLRSTSPTLFTASLDPWDPDYFTPMVIETILETFDWSTLHHLCLDLS